MRVIHITVKTKKDEETAYYVSAVLLYLSNNNYHSICQQIDTSGNGSTSPPLDSRHEDCGAESLKCLSCRRQPISKTKQERSPTSHLSVHGFCPRSLSCCRQPISKTKQERNTTSHLFVHGICILDHSLLQGLSCCRQPITKKKQNPTAHLPCMDHVKLDQPISINAHIVVNAPEPATTLQHLNNLDACSPYQTPDATRCVQVHFDAVFYPSSEDNVSSRPAKSLTPSPVAAPESPFDSSRADAEIKFQVRQLLVEDHSPIFLNSLRGGLHIPEALRLFLGAGSHWQTRHETSPDLPQLLLQPFLSCGEEELVRRVHTLFVRSAQQVQVVYELQVQEEKEGVRQEVREVEGESKARRNAHMNMYMRMR